MTAPTRSALRVLLQFVVAGGLTEVVHAWVVDLSLASRVAILAVVQLGIAFAQTRLEDQGEIPPVLRPRRLAAKEDDRHAG